MTMSMGPDSLLMDDSTDPMNMSVGPDYLAKSGIASDPMAMSMGPDSLKKSMADSDPMTMSLGPDSLAKSVAPPDPMTTSMFGTINGMDDKTPIEPSPTKPEQPAPSESVTAPPEPLNAGRSVPGTNMRCLDDPSFMFDHQKPASGPKVLEAPSEPPISQPKIGGYRVLEAPDSPPVPKSSDQPPTNLHENPAAMKPSPYKVLEAPLDEAPSIGKSSSPYRVLEAPDPSFYPGQQQASAGAGQETKPPALVSPSSGRTVTDALDKARSRFDSFWGGNKDKDPPSKV